MYFRPAILLLISLIGGILLGSRYPGFEIGAGALVIVSVACILRHVHRRQGGVIFPILLFVGLGSLSIGPWVAPRLPGNHLTHYAGSERWEITGRIDDHPQPINKRIRFVLRVSSLADDRQTHAVRGKLRVSAAGEWPPLTVGDELRFKGRIRLISNFKNPGGFDYRRYMAFRGIRASAYVQGDRLTVINPTNPTNPASNRFEFIHNARRTFSGLIDRYGSVKARALLKALIIGDRTQIAPEVRQSFNRAGVGHLLAISGLHIGIVATVAFIFFQALAVRIKPLLWQAATRKAAALITAGTWPSGASGLRPTCKATG